MSGVPGGTKTVFPLSLPLAAQTLLFPGPANSLVRCGHGRGNISPLESARSHCSCDKLHCHSSSPAMNTHNRILLPVSHASQTVPSSFGSYSGSSLSDPWLRIASAASRSNYESVILNGFPLYGKFSSESYPALDYALLANARRKNATRETTSTLKSWLNEHRKNPYPTKGEKIMLAILTKMTLTQVSTWFANARRRLKKENKMTWSPRKKTGDRKVLPGGGGKNDNLSDCDSDGDDDDGEDMDIHIEVEVDSELAMPKLLPAGLDGGYGLSGDIRQSASASASASRHGGSEPVVMPRASVIRAMDSPTFDEIKSRFKENSSPVNNLQRWVNGCFVTDVGCDYPRQLTPPTTPVDDRVSPSASDKAFDSFGVKCDYPATDCTGEGSAGVVVDVRGQPPPPLISVMTPQPSPRASDKTGLTTVGDGNQVGRTRHVQIISPDPVQNEVRTQGLTTSREFEAVLALTALSKT